MKLTINLKPGAKHEKLEKINEHEYRIWVKAQPVDGKANEAMIKALSEHLSIPKSSIEICSGHTSRKKLVEIC